MPTNSLLLLLLTNKILDLGAKVDTKSPKNQIKGGSSSPKRFIRTSSSLGCRISGNCPDIYVRTEEKESRSFVPNTQIAYVQVPRGSFTSLEWKRWFSQCNILHVNDCYKPDPLPTSIHTPSLSRIRSPKKKAQVSSRLLGVAALKPSLKPV